MKIWSQIGLCTFDGTQGLTTTKKSVGVHFFRGRVYDSQNGKSCHQADWKALRGALVGCLALMRRKSSSGVFTRTDAKAVAQSFLQNLQVQSLGQRDRKLTIVALIASTLFLRTNMHRNSVEDGGIYAGALFFSVIITLFNGMAELSMTIARLPVFYKQRDLLFYPPCAYALPAWILKIPISCIEAAVWVFITYYIIGFDPNVGRLFREYLLLALVNQMAFALFRFIAVTGRNMVIANTFGSCALLTLFALGGFVLSRAFGKSQAIKTEESESTEHNDRTEEGTQLRQRRNNSTHDTEIEYGDEIRTGSTLSNSSSLVIDAAIVANKSRQKGMVLPFEPHSITFDDIIYSVDMPQEMKNQGVLGDKLVLLEGVSGAFRPDILTALMGVSGAGKTTLMDVLAGRKTGGYIEGNITISGYPKKQETFARICGYCEQNDIHSPHVTVYESLVYSVWLRLSSEVRFETRQLGLYMDFIADVDKDGSGAIDFDEFVHMMTAKIGERDTKAKLMKAFHILILWFTSLV
ncbi:hypothetical protein SO802_031007 [Lithocarpus litseifolius]|uniref:EF-hand domain-containing protein n=1 Tax=Lithocarpus litseifolius TaxID=425828 RepID=A0AAW2BJ23_9ROSI